jgi:hypothetical protein
LAQSIEVEGRFNCLSHNTNKIKQIKQEELNDNNDKLYQMLKNAPPSVKQTDLERHTEKFYRVKNHINTNFRNRHQKLVAAKIVKQKEISMMSQSSYTHKASMTLLNSERRTQLQVSPLSMSSRTR